MSSDWADLSDGEMAEYWAGFRVPMCPTCGWRGMEPVSTPFAVGDPAGMGGGETAEHKGLKADAASWLRKRGYRVVQMEQWFALSRELEFRRGRPQRYVRIDVVAQRSRRDVVAIECGQCEARKLAALTRVFPEVWHWRFNEEEPRRVPKSSEFRGLRKRRERPTLPDWLQGTPASGPYCPKCGGELEPAE